MYDYRYDSTGLRAVHPVGGRMPVTAPITRILHRLTKVSSTREGQWVARCPSHEDKTPSLSVRENSDGAVLLRCFGGCTVHDVVAALGLDIADLFPPREPRHGAPKRLARTLTAYQALELLDCAAPRISNTTIQSPGVES